MSILSRLTHVESVSDNFIDATDLLRESSSRELLSDLIAMNAMRTNVVLRCFREPNYCPLVWPPIRVRVRIGVRVSDWGWGLELGLRVRIGVGIRVRVGVGV